MINIIGEREGDDVKVFELLDEITEVVAAQGQGLILTILAEGNEDAEKEIVRAWSVTYPTYSQELEGGSSQWLSKYPLFTQSFREHYYTC